MPGGFGYRRLRERGARAFTTVTNIISGDVNFRPRVTAGVNLRTILKAFARQTAGVAVSIGPTTARVVQKVGTVISTRVKTAVIRPTQTAGVRVSTFFTGNPANVLVTAGANIVRTVFSGTGRALQSVGVKLTTVISGTIAKPLLKAGHVVTANVKSLDGAQATQVPAANVVQITYDLTHQKGGNAATQENGCTGRQDWTNIANGTGERGDGFFAELQGALTGARDGILVLNYANFPDKSALTITQVRLLFSTSQTGTALNNGNMDHRWRKGGGAWTVLETFTGNVNYSSGPFAYDITASITVWSDLDSLEAGVRGCMDLGENLINVNCEAVELEITATLTEAV